MAYEVVMPYHLHMPSYFLETFTEYPYVWTFASVCMGLHVSMHEAMRTNVFYNALVGYCFSLIMPTQPAPIMRNIPANTNMLTSGATLPAVVNIFNIIPPNEAATICGMQMVPLKSPK